MFCTSVVPERGAPPTKMNRRPRGSSSGACIGILLETSGRPHRIPRGTRAEGKPGPRRAQARVTTSDYESAISAARAALDSCRDRFLGNYRIREIVARTVPGCELSQHLRRRHPRLPRLLRQNPRAADFECAWDAERGARQRKAVFERIGLTRLKELKHLSDTAGASVERHGAGLGRGNRDRGRGRETG